MFRLMVNASQGWQCALTDDKALDVTPTVSPLMIPLWYCHINSFQRASGVEKPLPRGEKEERRAGSASRGIGRRLGRSSSRVRHPVVPDRERVPDPCKVDGNQLCDLGHATQAILFYRGLRAMAQSEQSLDIGI